MAKVLVLYHSAYGHIETMANAIAEGARAAGAEVDVKRVPETVPFEVAQAAHFKLDQAAPVASVAEKSSSTLPSQSSSSPLQSPSLWAR